MKNNLIFFLVMLTASLQAQVTGQQVLAAAGDFFEGGSFSVSYTIGELAVQTLSSPNLILTQGFQQPGESATGISIPAEQEWTLKTWPNPVTDILFLQVVSGLQTDLVVESYDILGRLHSVHKFESPLQKDPYSIDMRGMESGIYILKIRAEAHSIHEIIRIRKH